MIYVAKIADACEAISESLRDFLDAKWASFFQGTSRDLREGEMNAVGKLKNAVSPNGPFTQFLEGGLDPSRGIPEHQIDNAKQMIDMYLGRINRLLQTMTVLPSGYRAQRGSDVKRDGMFLELIDERTGEEIAEVFHSDANGEMTVSCYRQGLPLDLLEQLIAMAKADFPPQMPPN
jgi:hypothetical protein